MGARLGKLCGKRASKAERLERIAGKERERQLARRAKARARRVKREERAAEIKARGGGALGLCKRAATAGGDAGDSDKEDAADDDPYEYIPSPERSPHSAPGSPLSAGAASVRVSVRALELVDGRRPRGAAARGTRAPPRVTAAVYTRSRGANDGSGGVAGSSEDDDDDDDDDSWDGDEAGSVARWALAARARCYLHQGGALSTNRVPVSSSLGSHPSLLVPLPGGADPLELQLQLVVAVDASGGAEAHGVPHTDDVGGRRSSAAPAAKLSGAATFTLGELSGGPARVRLGRVGAMRAREAGALGYAHVALASGGAAALAVDHTRGSNMPISPSRGAGHRAQPRARGARGEAVAGQYSAASASSPTAGARAAADGHASTPPSRVALMSRPPAFLDSRRLSLDAIGADAPPAGAASRRRRHSRDPRGSRYAAAPRRVRRASEDVLAHPASRRRGGVDASHAHAQAHAHTHARACLWQRRHGGGAEDERERERERAGRAPALLPGALPSGVG